MFHPTVSPHDPNLAVLNCDMTGAYITRDGGASWREFNLRTTLGAFAFDPVHPNIVYAGSDGVFRSDDRGGDLAARVPRPEDERKTGWWAITPSTTSIRPIRCGPATDTAVQAIRVDPDNADHVYVAMASWGAAPALLHAGRREHVAASVGFGSQTVVNLFIDPTSAVDRRRLVMVTDASIYSVDLMAGSSRG